MSVDVLDRLVDQRTGIVRRVRRRALPEPLPPGLTFVVAELSDTAAGLGAAAANPTASGCGFAPEEVVRTAAIAEAAERYCGALIPDGLPCASAVDLEHRGLAHIDPDALTLYAEDQYAAPGFPFVPFDRELPVHWVPGTTWDGHHEVLAPAALVFLTWGIGPTSEEPPTNLPVNAGIAAGDSRVAAARAALTELVERDAVSRAWASGRSLPRLVVPFSLRDLGAGRRGTLRTSFHAVPTAVGLPVVAAVVRDPEHAITTMGTACREDPRAAARKALAEAAMLQVAARDLDDPGSSVHDEPVLKAWRADRAYRSDYAADLHDAVDVLCHLQLALDPGVQRDLERRLADGPRVALDDLAAGRRLADVPARLPTEPVCVDLTTPDVASAGLSVVRVVAPGLRATAPAAFPFLGGDDLDPADRCVLPLPHA